MKNPFQLCAGALFVCAVNVSAGDGAKSGHIEEVKVSASRLPIVAEGQALTTIDTADNSSLRLDDTLRQAPGFSLFRRANSLTAHPTTQGLSARGVGANGAGRVLVTLDGVPLNNPFGGWVYWSSLNQREIASVNILRGGSASAFGPQGLAGTVSLNSVIPEENSGYLTAEYGEFNSYTLSAGGSLVAGKNHLSVSAGRFDSAGPFLLSPQQRGPIDVRAASESRHLGLRGGFQLADATRVSGSLRYFDEDRTNGLAAASNTTDSLEGSIQVLHQTDNHLNWELLAYYRNTDFANVFASARDDRTTERPVLDQFDVPGRGGGLLARLQFAGFEVGVEGRQAKGETNERFRNLGQGFTRLRIAGGEQRILGVFADYHREGSWGALSLSTRLDRYRTFNGQRREQNLADGSPLRNDPVPIRKGSEFSGRAGLRYHLNSLLTLNGAVYRSWRLPTINEFYRPFRVVNDITEANPNLLPETLYGAELGLDAQFSDHIRGSISYYRNRFNDGVGNITVGFGPGFFPLGGFVPAGGVLRQRANIDRTDIDGLELESEFRLGEHTELVVRYLYADSRIRSFAANPSLVGNRPVQTPRHSVFSAFRQSFFWGKLTLQGRYSGSQFDDDLNQRRLPGVFTANLAAAYRVNETVSVSLAVENLFDRTVISAVSATGLETLAQQRFWRAGVEVSF